MKHLPPDTLQVTSAAVTGVIPTNVCLRPSASNGVALISPACKASLYGIRDQVNARGSVNNHPTIDGDRRMSYIWAFSACVKRQLFAELAVSLDCAGNRATLANPAALSGGAVPGCCTT